MKSLTLLALLSCAACSSGPTADEAEPAPAALVALARADQGNLAQDVIIYGVAEGGAGAKASLSAPAEAIVSRIVAPVGTRVSAGDIVVQLSASPTTRLDIVKASTDARAADAAYARARRLRTDGLVGNAELEAARAAAAAADATRASLGGRAGALTLRASSAGFVETIPVNPGDTVQAGAVVATIARPGDLRGRFGADPAVARALHRGEGVMIAATKGRAAFTVPVDAVTPVVDPATRLASIFVRIPAQVGLAVGETLTGSVAVSSSNNMPTIPYAALLDDGGQPYVYIVKANVAHRHDVVVGATQGDRVSIVKGVGQGDTVVTQGGTAVEDGMKVRTQ
ncbi:Efflux RND transporter periplasmic adaptor subunit [Sphingomonas antarctica]|uniref:efflux RND transporter periplasmic adaptor subunit n=1 Tax=Sphingomonas antarctica TaxID=2040274 RepID=UPI0039E9316E